MSGSSAMTAGRSSRVTRRSRHRPDTANAQPSRSAARTRSRCTTAADRARRASLAQPMLVQLAAMSTIAAPPLTVPAHERTVQRALLLCGILSSVFYVLADQLGALSWADYRISSQTVSELSAYGAPSRPLVVSLLLVHTALTLAFGLGIWRVSADRRRL